MGRLFLVCFHGVRDFYICRICRTVIALNVHFRYPLQPHSDGATGLIFGEVANMYKREPMPHREVGRYETEDLYCVECGDLLGGELVRSLGPLELDDDPLYYLNPAKILHWNGRNTLDPTMLPATSSSDANPHEANPPEANPAVNPEANSEENL
ncbi:unnamed protein product [Ilex paraguariensis]|uniref:Yippee domain-containing protein n=1 Tax=Ilex paraguariensis TaxID=185542 RepID=A0ABC8R5C6_9AQUA